MNAIMNPFWWKMKWYNIRAWFNPHQKWLTKKIPNTYCDCVDLPWICLSEMLIHFVEVEDGLESIWGERYLDDPHVSEHYRSVREPVRKELEEIYEYIKNERPNLQKELDDSYPTVLVGDSMFSRFDEILKEDGKKVKSYKTCEELYGKSYQETYSEVHRLEKLIDIRDTWAMTGIIKNRQYLWV